MYPRVTEALVSGKVHGRTPDMKSLVRQAKIERAASSRILADEAFWYPDETRVFPQVLVMSFAPTGATMRLPWQLASFAKALLRRDRSALLHLQTVPRGSPEGLLARWLGDCEKSHAPKIVSKLRGPSHVPTFIGHASVSWAAKGLRVWTDPFFAPRDSVHPSHDQPLRPSDFAEARHCVLITHAHPDHFDPASILQFPSDTLFVVPKIARETILSTRIAYRLGQLGYAHIQELDWWAALKVGEFEITSLPFYGEQPLAHGEILRQHNQGNTYAVRSRAGGLSLVLADSGSDARQHHLGFAREVRNRLGPARYLFANHRRWSLYPAEYLITSVPQYLCFAGDQELLREHRIMLSPEELAESADIFGATFVVPYAMGGTRWHEAMGLGWNNATKARPSTAFDSSPFDLRALSAKRAWSLRVPMAGQSILHNGDVSPLVAPTPKRARRVRKGPQPICRFSVLCGAFTPTLLRKLARALTSSPGSFLIATVGAVEIHFEASLEGAATRMRVHDLVKKVDCVSLIHGAPWTGAPFFSSKDARWYGLFESLHRELNQTSNPSPSKWLRILRNALDAKVFSAVSGAAIASVCKGLLGLDLACEREAHGRPPQWDPLDLPASAAGTVVAFGAVQTGLALLWVKACHNMFFTGSAMGLRRMPSSEMDWMRRALG